jgi:2-dehydro-3-deoxyglucarate aldolase/4-hydroxy-2-oxoheptanedioate aldolase
MNDSTTRIGTWLSVGSPVIAELAAECGFDWVLLDLEHGCDSEAALPSQLRALRGFNTQSIVRVGGPNPDLIGRVLDWGASGIMVPHVNTVHDAFQVLKAAQYPPQGRRGYSRTVRAYGYGLRPLGDHPTPPTIIAQIETLEGVEHAYEIAAVAGISALFVGPADLNFDLKAHHSARTYDECLQKVAKAAHDHNKPCGILVRSPDDLPKMKALGYTWLAVDSDLSLLREGFSRNLIAARA